MDYILRISGDFEKGECWKCPLHYEKTVKYEFAGGIATETELKCRVSKRLEDCPLEEATVAKNATTEGEWMDKLIAELEEELELAVREKQMCASRNPLQFDSAKGYANGIANALDMVKNAYEEMKGGAE